MDVYIARQPILNREKELFAYELLYRSNTQNSFSNIDGDKATSEVIHNLFQIGVNELSEGKPCFINFTDNLLEKLVPTYFHKKMVVVEVLETVQPTNKIIMSCRKLKELGYRIALDDFEMKWDNENYLQLVQLADIIKVDIQKTPRYKQIVMLNSLKRYHVEFLAEKVENQEEYEQCKKDGYSYFQGYFFSKPVILASNDVPEQSHSLFVLLHELSKEEPDINKITDTIEVDISLSYKLLKLINSPVIGIRNTIKSIRQAIVLLGFNELRKWIFLLSLREVRKNDSAYQVLIKMSLTRAKFCEEIAIYKGMRNESSTYFLVGLFSLMDSLMQRPMESIMEQLPLEDELKQAIMGSSTSYSEILQLSIHMERANWSNIDDHVEGLGIKKKQVFDLFVHSMKWANEMMDVDLLEDTKNV